MGMYFYEKILFGRYKRIGGSPKFNVFDRYLAGGSPLYYCVSGKNIDHMIDKIKIDLGNYVYEEKILEEDYYLIPFKLKGRYELYDKIKFYNTDNKNITEEIIKIKMNAYD